MTELIWRDWACNPHVLFQRHMNYLVGDSLISRVFIYVYMIYRKKKLNNSIIVTLDI